MKETHLTADTRKALQVKLDKSKNKDRDTFMDDKERHGKKSVRKQPRGGQRTKNALKYISPADLDKLDDLEFDE